MPNIPASKLWTLRLKRSNSTTLLFADPAQSLKSLKEALLSALRSAPSTGPVREQVPTDPRDVEIGKPVDLFELSKGWELVDSLQPTKSQDASLRSLGIKENYVLAYRFKDDEFEADEDDETMGEEKGWNVDIPVYEDTYGVETEGDLGAVPEYRG